MKALIKSHDRPGLWLGEVAKPIIDDHEVLIKINKTAICGTDLHIYNWDAWSQKNVPVGIQTGHEFMGTIVEVGRHVQGLREGDRVSGEGHLVCGHCRNCRAGRRHLCIHTQVIGVHIPGCFAEFLKMPAGNVFPLPDNVDDRTAAIFDPLGNAVHTALSFDLVGEDILITGAGPIGIMAAKIAQYVGGRHVVLTDIAPDRLALAQKMGITHAVNTCEHTLAATMQKLGMTEGFDVGLEMSGSPQALNGMLETMNAGGKIALLGILPPDATVSWDSVIFKGLQIKGIFGREMFETWYKMAALIQSGLDIDAIFTHTYAAEDFEKGFAAMKEGRSGKVILEWLL